MLSPEAHRAPRAPVIAARSLSLAAALAFAIGGCGDEEDSSPPAEPAATDLTLALDADGPGGERARTQSVVCQAGADASACAALTPADFEPTPPDVACTEIYGGPDEVTVEGVVIGEPVSATLTRANGCEIERFDRVTPLLQDLFPGYRPGASLAP